MCLSFINQFRLKLIRRCCTTSARLKWLGRQNGSGKFWEIWLKSIMCPFPTTKRLEGFIITWRWVLQNGILHPLRINSRTLNFTIMRSGPETLSTTSSSTTTSKSTSNSPIKSHPSNTLSPSKISNLLNLAVPPTKSQSTSSTSPHSYPAPTPSKSHTETRSVVSQTWDGNISFSEKRNSTDSRPVTNCWKWFRPLFLTSKNNRR